MTLGKWFITAGCEMCEALRHSLGWLRRRVVWVLVATAAFGGCLRLLLPLDDPWLLAIQQTSWGDKSTARDAAEWISWAGDFWFYNLPCAALLVFGAWRINSERWRRIAVIFLAGTILAGGAAMTIRGLTGRPRPSAKVADGFYGPHLSSKMQAFPSGHTGTAFGGALPVLAAVPLVGAPFTAIAMSISWSRLYLNRHHPTDVLASIYLAVIFAIPLRAWYRKLEGAANS